MMVNKEFQNTYHSSHNSVLLQNTWLNLYVQESEFFFLCRDIIRNKSYIEWSYGGYRSIFQIFLYQTKWVVLLTWHTVMYKLYSCTNLLSSTFLFFSWLDNRLALAWPSATIKHAEVTLFFKVKKGLSKFWS